MAYCTAEDYEARYGDATDRALLGVVLDEVSVKIAAALDANGIDYDASTEEYKARVSIVCRDVAHRALGQADAAVPFGATQYSEAVGPYSTSFTLGGSYGDTRLFQSDRELLGIASTVAYVGIAGDA